MIDLQDVSVGNPFPGLRPFETDEYHLFFGREGQSDELIKRLRVTRFLAVVGTSGSGKSSLVRAGLLPALQGGLMPGAGSSWRVAIIRPGHDPIGNLAHELGAILDDGHTDLEIQNTLIETTLRRSTLGLVDAVRQARMSPHEKLLVVVDQFEELFRFKEARKETDSEDDALGFVKLLIEASAHVEVPIYVVLTMRSDFLGDCSQFAGLPEAINQGQYLIPRMSRDERQAAVTGPVAVGGGEMTVPLINRLLNDVGDNPDQLPILQHALMRTWNHWSTHRSNGDPIGLEHYDAVGTMSDALSLHADEAWAELDQRGQEVAELLFKTLTERGADNREIRRPTSLQDICAITNTTEAEVVAVIDIFRGAGRSFLMPPAGVVLKPETVVDISHESLIRNWDRLRAWVDDEAQSARIYRRLAEAATDYYQKAGGLLDDVTLQYAMKWHEQEKPQWAWGVRYHPDFNTATSYLELSTLARDARIEAEQERDRRELETTRAFAEKQARSARRLRWLAIGMAVMFLLALATAGYAMTQRTQAQANERIAADREKDAVRQKAALADALAVKERAEEARLQSDMSRDRAEHGRLEAEMQRKEALARALSEAKRANEQARVAAAKQVEAEKLRDEALASREANSLYRSAYSSWNNDNLTRARDNFRNAAKQFQGLKDYSAVGASLFALAEIDIKDTAAKQRDEAAAFDSYEEAARYYEQSNDRDGIASVLAAKGAYLTKYPSEAPSRPSPKVPRDGLREEEGLKFLEQALAGYEATGNWEAAISVVELIRPLFWFKPDEKQRVIADTEKLLTLFTKAKDSDGQKKVMLELSTRYEREGNHARANEYREAAVKVYRDLGDHRKEAGTLVEVAVNEPSLDANEREAYLERALQVFQRVRDPEGELDMLTRIGNQYLTRGGDLGTPDKKVRLSGKYLEKALAIYESLGRRKEQAGLLTYMGSHARSVASSSRLKEHDELALEYYLRALAIYRALNDKANEKETLAFVAAGYSLVKRLPEAIETNKQLLAFETEPAKQVDRLREIAFMQRELKSPEMIDTFRKVLAFYESTNQKLMQASTLVSIGIAQIQFGQPAQAADSLNRAVRLHAGANDKNGRSNALYWLGTAQEALGKLPAALETFKQALALFRETNDNARAAEAEKRIEAITRLLQPK